MKYYLNFVFLFSIQMCTSQVISLDSLYSCGFESSFAVSELKSTVISNPELKSIIETNYKNLFGNYLGLDINSITIEQSGEENQPYKYAAAVLKYVDENIGYNRYIIFDPKSLTPEVAKMGNGWVIRCILLHEIAHHLNFDNLRVRNQKEAELFADYFAGVNLGRLKLLGAPNLDLSAASMAIDKLITSPGNDSYPSKKERLNKFIEGWNVGNAMPQFSTLYSIAFSIKNNADKKMNKEFVEILLNRSAYVINIDENMPKPENKIKSPNITPNFFIRENTLIYSLDSKTEIEIGQLIDTDRIGYKKMIYDKYLYFWYITNENEVYYLDNENKIYIGKVK